MKLKNIFKKGKTNSSNAKVEKLEKEKMQSVIGGGNGDATTTNITNRAPDRSPGITHEYH